MMKRKPHPIVGDSNLVLLMFNMPRTQTQVVIKGLMWVYIQKVGLILMIIFGFAMSNDKKLPIDIER
ncbi:hypothetical protein HpMS120_08760 [Helicobacter pylori]